MNVNSYTQIIALYITGAMNVMLSAAHKYEILRYIYVHQVPVLIIYVSTAHSVMIVVRSLGS